MRQRRRPHRQRDGRGHGRPLRRRAPGARERPAADSPRRRAAARTSRPSRGSSTHAEHQRRDRRAQRVDAERASEADAGRARGAGQMTEQRAHHTVGSRNAAAASAASAASACHMPGPSSASSRGLDRARRSQREDPQQAGRRRALQQSIARLSRSCDARQRCRPRRRARCRRDTPRAGSRRCRRCSPRPGSARARRALRSRCRASR